MIPYRPEPFTDFQNPLEAQAFQSALDAVLQEMGKEYPAVVGGRNVQTGQFIVSVNPSETGQIIGQVCKADAILAEQAIQSAYKVRKDWSLVSAETRAEILFKAAAILRRKKHRFTAWVMLEAGKTRGEADGETAEAIDFLEYYGRQMLRLLNRGEEELIRLPGERNRLDYLPLGVGVIIPPWNFPLAILAGMTAAAIVAGNTAVLKPASATPVIGYKFVELLTEAGLPPGIVQFVPGNGSEIGDLLVGHKLTRFIAFTGSREVGQRIFELSAKISPGQIWLKRFIGEMGGKDAIIVDRDADLAKAAQGIVTSAFGYSGQKCSACSRAIVHRDIYDEVLERSAALTNAFKVGHVLDAASDTGPVIDRQAYDKITQYIGIGKREGRLAAGGGPAGDGGFYLSPVILADVLPEARIMQEEIFGPVLAFAKADDFSHALDIANRSEYGLTGSVYTRNRSHIERARAEFHAGNLYINRKCTGALVGVHPFGGFHMSGTDSKAGGPDYLLLFTQPKLTSELL